MHVSTSQGAETEEMSGGDVYVAETPSYLEEGLERHTISVFVGDETGLLNRVVGVFARRGFNIETLCVGLSANKALFTIMVVGRPNEIKSLIKQIYKLVNVYSATDITHDSTVERGIMLAKVKCSGSDRSQVLELTDIFRGSIVDVADESVMVCLAGDPGKTRAFQRAVSKYGIMQVARTGKLAMLREPAFDAERNRRYQLRSVMKQMQELSGNKEAVEENREDVALQVQLQSLLSQARQEQAEKGELGVYRTALDETSAWDVPVLMQSGGANTEMTAEMTGLRDHVLSILVENKPGVLDAVTGVIARRGYNVQSLGVGPAETFDVSRITLVVPGTQMGMQNLLKQIKKLVTVLDVEDLTNNPFVERELIMVKVWCDRATRPELVSLIDVFRGKISDVSGDTITVEVAGDVEKTTAFQELLKPYGIVELARTGRVALKRDSGIDTNLLGRLSDDRLFA